MPAIFWFVPGSLKHVQVPILVRMGELDQTTPPSHAASVLGDLASHTLVEAAVIPGAGHFSIMSKFPKEMTRLDFPPSQDPPGFDREAIQQSLFAEITSFFRRNLCGT